MILKRLEDAKRDGDRIYAVIKGLGAATCGGVETEIPAVHAYRTALEQAYADADVEPGTVGYLETHGSGHPDEDALETEALLNWRRGGPGEVPCTLGSSKADIGHAGAAAGLAGLIKTALCLYQEILPPLRHLTDPRPELSDFHLPRTPQTWVRDRTHGPRRAGVSSFSVDGNVLHVVLEGHETADAKKSTELLQPLGVHSEALFAVEADTTAGLLEGLHRLRAHVEGAPTHNIEALARSWWHAHPSNSRRKLATAQVARHGSELLKQIALTEEWITGGARPPGERIFYSPTPLGEYAQVAFVFPGSGSHFPDMGRELALQWPEILRQQDREVASLRSQFLPEVFWNLPSLETIEDQRSLLFGQLSVGALVSDLVREHGIQPSAVLGYSLGETVGLFALCAWTGRDEMLRRMTGSTLFVSDLAGPCAAARKTWKLSDEARIEWVTGVVSCPADRVRAVLRDREHVYLLITNTPGEAVIGGERRAVADVVQTLDCRFVPVPGVASVHCEVVSAVAEAYRDLHSLPTTSLPGVQFYSGGSGRSYEVSRESAADAILAQAARSLDFPALINQAYADGVRVFLEMGPGASCSRMIGQILGDRPHLARSACAAGQDAVSSILRLLAEAIAERVPVDLKRLYGQASLAHGHRVYAEPASKSAVSPVVIPLGGKLFVIPEPPRREHVKALPPWSTAHEPRRHDPDVTRGPIPETQPPPVTGPLLRQMTATAAAKAQRHASAFALRPEPYPVAFKANRTSDGVVPGLSRLGHPRNVWPKANGERGRNPGTDPSAYTAGARERQRQSHAEAPAFDRDLCLEFAIGSIAGVLGPEFAEIDTFPTRVRLPDEPLMLVDRIVSVSGERRSLASGGVITEHDIRPDAWYLDCGRLPTCIAVEAGQADLFLAGYLGIDFKTRGLAVYRLLDAVVTFHRSLPGPGSVLRYDIRIQHFFHHADAWLFRFNYECTADGEPLLTMRDGCAGFFTAAALAAGKGIVHTERDQSSRGQASDQPTGKHSYR